MSVAHDIRLFTVTSIHRKPVEADDTTGNLRQVSKRWQKKKIQESNKREIKLVKSEEKKRYSKEETDWCSMHVKVIRAVDEEHVSSENESTFC